MRINKKIYLLLLTLSTFTGWTESFISKDAEWKYYDSKDAPAKEWNQMKFDDSSWKVGKASLGYGNGDEKTKIAHENISTAYFRKKIKITESPQGKVVIGLNVDDGAVVYLNGKEVCRLNMPRGRVEHSTLALYSVWKEEEKRFLYFFIEKTDLIAGKENLIAVQVHQARVGSPDMKFALEMKTFEEKLPESKTKNDE